MAKGEFIQLRVAVWEKFHIINKAKMTHMSLSEFVRKAAMDKDIVVFEGLDELARELRHEGNNLNQLTVMARKGNLEQINYAEFLEAYEKVWQAL